MNELTIFKNEDFGEIRTIEKDDEIWFVLNDVCTILEIVNARDTKSRLEKGDVGTTDIIDNLGRVQKMSIINEYALYECVLLSRKLNARQFKHWITHEVIPQIRKTGTYKLSPKSYAEALRALANEVEQKELIQKQRDEAIRTKAWISDRKTATAMNTASQKSKEAEKLKIELDRSKKFASIKAVEISLKQKFDWKPLRNYCTAHELEMPKIFDANYGKVRTYPAKAWAAIYEVDLEELF